MKSVPATKTSTPNSRHSWRLTHLLAAFIGLHFISVGCASAGGGEERRLVLAEDSGSEYVILLADDSSRSDRYAAEELAVYMGLITGAEYPLLSISEWDGDAPFIHIGSSALLSDRLGVNVLEEVGQFDWVVQSNGRDIFLFGGGIHATTQAVFDFLERDLGWRWYSYFEYPLLPQRDTVILEPVDRSGSKSFPYLGYGHLARGMDHPWQMGATMGFDKRVQVLDGRSDEVRAEDFPFRSALPESNKLSSHSLHRFIPPTPDSEGADALDWLERKNYFETNPEYFSMNERGERFKVRTHLNFGNAGLRAELTKNILEFIDREGDGITIEIGAMDSVGRLCHSPESVALEEKYQTPGGPMIDYVIELCELLKENHPNVMVKTLAYRREQTQIPPVLPDGGMLPDNLIIDFAPVEDNYFGDWAHPDEMLQETFSHLKGWAEIVPEGNLWAWIYPNPWRTGHTFPVGNVDRLVTNMRLMHELGVAGLWIDHNGHRTRSGFSELQAWLIYKLSQDINLDDQELIAEFTDYMYGPAAPLFRRYLNELEAERKAMETLPPRVRFRSTEMDDATFPYLTPENIHRWQGYFDEMQALCEGLKRRYTVNLDLARRELDFATLWKWFDLVELAPDSYTDHTVLIERITAANSVEPEPAPEWEDRMINRRHFSNFGNALIPHFDTIIQAGGKEKPLPAELAGVDPANVRTFLPSRQRSAILTVLDPDAPFGFAVPADRPNLPFTFGIHDAETKTRLQNPVAKRDDITPGVYQLFDIGEVEISRHTVAYFGQSWQTKLDVSNHLHEPGAENRWHAYAELKFDGPSYGGTADEDIVLVGRVIFVSLSKDQF